jgi:hypothetical protein
MCPSAFFQEKRLPKGASEAFTLCSVLEKWWARQDLNLGPTDYESAALTAELRARRALML